MTPSSQPVLASDNYFSLICRTYYCIYLIRKNPYCSLQWFLSFASFLTCQNHVMLLLAEMHRAHEESLNVFKPAQAKVFSNKEAMS